MVVGSINQSDITQDVDNLYYESGYAQKEIAILMNASNENLSDPAVLAQIQQAYQFFEALKNGTTFTTPDGKVMDFSVFGAGGIFGADSAHFESLVDNVLNSFNNIKIPDPNGNNDTVYDKTTGQPATLYDLIARPNDDFYFKFTVSSHVDGPTFNWFDNFENGGAGNGLFPSTHTGQVVTDSSGNTIPGGGFSVTEQDQGVYHGAKDDYTVSGNAAAFANYCSVGSSDSPAAIANVQALDAFLSANM